MNILFLLIFYRRVKIIELLYVFTGVEQIIKYTMGKWEPGVSLMEKEITDKEKGKVRMNPIVFGLETGLSVLTSGL